MRFYVFLFMMLFITSSLSSQSLNNSKFLGYRGIWFQLGFIERMEAEGYKGGYGDKYSGGLSFAWSHTVSPMAIYVPEADKTFFVYGGTTEPHDNYLMVMASYYDHAKHLVPRPTIVRDQRGIDDPHDNPSITIDDEGYIWVFVAGRGRGRPGQIFKATEPYSVDKFEKIISREQTYSHIWHIPGEGFMHLLTLYTDGRELYWERSAKGDDWTEEPEENLQKLAGFGGHYQVTRLDDRNKRIGSAFNYHPEGNVDRRTNIYYFETWDFGETWTTIDGQELSLPLDNRDNPALVVDYEAEGRNAYITKLLYDDDGNPVILVVTSDGYMPGPQNDPRKWELIRWTGEEWITTEITTSDHNYDMGSLYIDGDRWTIIGPTLQGP
ncbi:MAG: BNR-4 repeat-containing protein, partial [bacterium]